VRTPHTGAAVVAAPADPDSGWGDRYGATLAEGGACLPPAQGTTRGLAETGAADGDTDAGAPLDADPGVYRHMADPLL
jgi:hypothetical protein